MKNRRFVILLLLLSVFIAGCVNLFDPETLIQNNAQVKAFMDDYPNADLTLVQFSANESEQLIEEIFDNCGKLIDKQPLYKFEIEDPDSGLNMVGYINSQTQQFVCVKKKGSGERHDDHDEHEDDRDDYGEEEIISDDSIFLDYVEVESKGFMLSVEALDAAHALNLELIESNIDFESELTIMRENGGEVQFFEENEGELKSDIAKKLWDQLVEWGKENVERVTDEEFVGARIYVSTFEDYDYDPYDDREDEEEYYDEKEHLEVHYEIDADIDFPEEFKESLYELKDHLYKNNREIEFFFEIRQDEDGTIKQDDEIEVDAPTDDEGALWNDLMNIIEDSVKSHEGHEVEVELEIIAEHGYDDHDKHEYEEEEHDMDDIIELCEEVKGGDFDHVHGECEGIGKDSCEYIGGEFDECASPCRHDEDAEACILSCEQTCYFDDYEKDYDEEEIEIEIELFEDGATVQVEINDDEDEFELDTNDLDEIIEKIMDKFDLSKDEVYDNKKVRIEDGEYLFKEEEDEESDDDKEDEKEEDSDDKDEDDEHDDDKEDHDDGDEEDKEEESNGVNETS